MKREGLNRDQILEIARRKGVFYVAPFFHTHALSLKCRRLVREGLLRRVPWKEHGVYGEYFAPVYKEEENV